jgi:broad specificity phosphatase PhoE
MLGRRFAPRKKMVYLIRHAKVKYKWHDKYSLSDFIDSTNEYDFADIETISNQKQKQIKAIIPKKFTLYTSTLKRSIETARLLFPEKKITVIKQLSEIPIEPYTNKNIIHPLWVWFFLGRLQWIINHKKQKRNRRIVNEEIIEIIQIMEKNKNSVIIGHGFQFSIMLNKMKKSYYISKAHKQIQNLDVILCEKKKGPTTAST